MGERPSNEASEIVKMLLEYSQGKGQLPNAIDFHIMEYTLRLIANMIGVDPARLDLQIDKLIARSVNQPAYFGRPLWAEYGERIAMGLNTKTEIITTQSKRLRIFDSGSK